MTLKPDPIQVADLEEYLNSSSDFAFELQVLEKLNSIGLECKHSGLYEDPITGKPREFDIRASWSKEYMRISAGVECKNIRENYPLVAHCTERTQNESFHNLVATLGKNRTVIHGYGSVDFGASAQRIRVDNAFYPPANFVAKSVDQVGRREHNGEITASDGSAYEKMSQAVHSAYDLLHQAHFAEVNERLLTFVLPILVVPDDRLWSVKYDSSGARLGKPELVDRISLYVGQDWCIGQEFPEKPSSSDFETYTLSHLEIVTVSQLDNFLSKTLQLRNIFTARTPEQLLLDTSLQDTNWLYDREHVNRG